jgi:hypothetical protein
VIKLAMGKKDGNMFPFANRKMLCSGYILDALSMAIRMSNIGARKINTTIYYVFPKVKWIARWARDGGHDKRVDLHAFLRSST